MAAALPFIAVGIGLIGTYISAQGQKEAGREAREAYEATAQIIERRGREQEAQARTRLSTLLGKQRSLYAKAGVDISSGSPLLVMSETAAEAEEEIQANRQTVMEEAELQRRYGRSTGKAADIGATSTILTGLGNTATNLYAATK